MSPSTGRPIVYTPTNGNSYVYNKDCMFFKKYRKARIALRTTWRDTEFVENLYIPNRDLEISEGLFVKVDKMDDGIHCVTPLGWINYRYFKTTIFLQAGPVYILSENNTAALSVLLHILGRDNG